MGRPVVGRQTGKMRARERPGAHERSRGYSERGSRLSAPDARSGGFTGIRQSDLDPALRTQAETQLHALLWVEGLPVRAVYRPGEVCRLLRISPTTLRQFCELAEHPAVPRRDPRALESFLVGCHHRISHAALVEWLARNQTFQREN